MDKYCIKCNEPMINVHLSKKYCDTCAKDRKNKGQLRRNKTKPISEFTDDILRSNFYSIIKEDYHLTPKGFDNISEYNSFTYLNYYNVSWCKILKLFTKDNDLLDYIIKEFKIFMNKTNSKSIKSFCREHNYLSENLIKYYGNQIISELSGIKYDKRNYTVENLNSNFHSLINEIGRVPLFAEFKNISPISLSAYTSILNLKGDVYNQIVKMFSSELQYKEYIKYRSEYKTKTSSRVANMNKTILSLDDLENEFRNVFDKCFVDTGIYPSTRLFNKLSKHDDSTYRKKLNMNWSNICKSYGYPTQQKQSIFETYVLKNMSIILNEEYESQKTFIWLRGINDFPLFCDGYFEKYNLVVEVDGRQHRKPYTKFGGEEAFITLQANDAVKNELIPEHGIKLLRIADNTKWHDVEYLRSKLEEVLGLSSLVAK